MFKMHFGRTSENFHIKMIVSAFIENIVYVQKVQYTAIWYSVNSSNSLLIQKFMELATA